MTFRSGFHNGVNRDRLYNASDFGEFFDGFIADGVFLTWMDAFTVEPGNGLKFIVKPGKAWLNKTWSVLSEQVEYSVVPGNTYNICIVVDKRPNVRKNSISVLTTPNDQIVTIPVEDGLYYYMIAEIVVPTGATKVKKVYIENFIGRIYTKNPNFVPLFYSMGLLNHTMLTRWTSWENEFNDWFAALKAAIENQSIDTLVSQTNALKSKVDSLEPQINTMVQDIQNILDTKTFWVVLPDNNSRWQVPANIKNNSIHIIAASGGGGGGAGGGGGGGSGGGGGGGGAEYLGNAIDGAYRIADMYGGGGGSSGVAGSIGGSGQIGNVSIVNGNVSVKKGDVISVSIGSGGRGGDSPGTGGNGADGGGGGNPSTGYGINHQPGTDGSKGEQGTIGTPGSGGYSGSPTTVYKNGTQVVKSLEGKGGIGGIGGACHAGGGGGGVAKQYANEYLGGGVGWDMRPGKGGTGASGYYGSPGTDGIHTEMTVHIWQGAIGETDANRVRSGGTGGSSETNRSVPVSRTHQVSVGHDVYVTVGSGGAGGNGGAGGGGGGGGRAGLPGTGGTKGEEGELVEMKPQFPGSEVLQPTYACHGGKGGKGANGTEGYKGTAGGPGAVIIEYQLSLPWFNN